MRSTAIIINEPTDGPAISVVGDTYRVLISVAQSEGKFAVIDMLIPPEGGPPPHAHADIEESFYVMDGEVVFRTELQTYTAKKGAYITIPLGGTIHNFKNESQSVAHLLCIVTPAGLDELFQEMGKPVAPGQFLPPAEMGPDELKNAKQLAEKYGQELFPPDYFKK